ncbi:hypothetical protein MTsN2n4_38210 [Pseudoalteromonas sp. MTN2-4]
MTRYKIGAWNCDFATQSITDGTQKRELDPLSFKLLEYFILNNERIITRQELIEQVWQKGFVDNNAINRAISDLRKTLKSELEPGLSIKTHYRKGYSLFLPVENITANSATTGPIKPLSANSKPLTTSSSKSKNNKYLVVLLCITIVGLILSFLYQPHTNSEPQSKADLIHAEPIEFTSRSLSWHKGTHTNELLSPNHKYLAHQNIPSYNVGLDNKIHILNLEKERIKVIELPFGKIKLQGWSDNSQRLYFSKQNGTSFEGLVDQTYCGIWSISNFESTSPTIEKLINCEKLPDLHEGSRVFSLKDTLFYNKRAYQDGSYADAIYAYDQKNQLEVRITTPSKIGTGDFLVGVTTKPDKIIFQRATGNGIKLYIGSANGHEIQEIADLYTLIRGVTYDEQLSLISWVSLLENTLFQFKLDSFELLEPLKLKLPRLNKAFVINPNHILATSSIFDTDAYQYNVLTQKVTAFTRPSITEYKLHLIDDNSHALTLYNWQQSRFEIVKYIDEAYQKIPSLDDPHFILMSTDIDHKQAIIGDFQSQRYQLVHLPSFEPKLKLPLEGRLTSLKVRKNRVVALNQDAETGTRTLFVYDTRFKQKTPIHVSNPYLFDWLDNQTIVFTDLKNQVYIYDVVKHETKLQLSISELNADFKINSHVQLAVDETGIYLAKDAGLVYKLKLGSSPELSPFVDLSEKIDKPIRLSSIRAQKGNLLFSSPSESDNEILSLTSKP